MGKKVQLWGRYISFWAGTIMLGVGSWGIGHQVWELGEHNHQTIVVGGIVAGVLGTLCYFMMWHQCTPVVRWCWRRLRHKPLTFVELLV